MGMEYKHDDDDNLHIFNSKIGEDMQLVFDMEGESKSVFTTDERRVYVSKDGEGDYLTVGDAFEYAESLPAEEPVTIIVKNGRYFEKLHLKKPNVTLIGEDAQKTIIENNSAAKDENLVGVENSTYKTATVHIEEGSDGFRCKNISFVNSAGIGKFVGQALAMYVDCDRAVFENCRFIGNQDTLLCAPNHVDYDNNINKYNRNYFRDCYIEGNVDFIFGGATAVFDNCEIFCRIRENQNKSYVTACCTPKTSPFGFVFLDCTICGDADKKSVYLGRPWRDYAKATFVRCTVTDVLHDEIFRTWNDTTKHTTSCYEICNCKDMDTSNIADWCYVLGDEEEADYTLEKIFGDWLPEKIG
jgi:pectinesterase